MQFPLIERYISRPRINRFLIATGGDQSLATELYLDNLLLSQAFHPLMGVLEVILRNAINEQLTIYFSNPDWITQEKNGFMQHRSLTYFNRRQNRLITNDFLLNQVLASESKLRNAGKIVNAGRVIAELQFSFWTQLYAPIHSQILSGQPMQIFPNLPGGVNRANVYRILNETRLFRNRLSHNEPICFTGTQYDCKWPRKVHKDVLDILTWIEPGIVSWISHLDFVLPQIDKMDGKY